MFIYYNNFWPKFNPEDYANKLFSDIFMSKIEITKNINNAHILCESVFGCATNSALFKKNWRMSFLFSAENYLGSGSVNKDKYTCILSGQISQKNNITFPLFFVSCIRFNNFLGENQPKQIAVPNKSICAVISNPVGHVRNIFLDKLEQVIKIDYGGKFRNNISKVPGNHVNTNIFEFYKQYKFVIAMENSQGDYYITEKIYNALCAGVIPVYWGSPKVSEFFNPARFIHLKNDSASEMQRVIDIIVNMSDSEYINIVSQHIFVSSGETLYKERISSIQKLLGEAQPEKCARDKCNYVCHFNTSNNGGTHCCYSCKTDKGHGPLCEHIEYKISC